MITQDKLIRLLVAAVTVLAAIGQNSSDDQPRRPDGRQQSPADAAAADARACVEAGTPGKMHEFLGRQVGVWEGKSRMWLGPGEAEPVTGTCVWTVSPLFDGRYIRCDMTGQLSGMPAFVGLGLTGFDHVTGKFVGSWIDNCGSGIMSGVGELSKDRTRLVWEYAYNCPVTKKPAVVRQIDSYHGPDSMAFDMFTTDPRSGTEYRCMHIDFTRKR